jgi:hypothetical protein
MNPAIPARLIQGARKDGRVVLGRWLAAPPFVGPAVHGLVLAALLLELAALAGGLLHRHADWVLDHN